MTNDIRFYDTSSLIIAGEAIFQREAKFVISSITFGELENIKNSKNKDLDTKYMARNLLRLFEQHPDQYEVVLHKKAYEDAIEHFDIEVNDDLRILSDAINYDKNVRPDEVVFVTNDLALKYIANLYFGSDMIDSEQDTDDDYVGYKEISADDDKLCAFYGDTTYNHYNLHIGEYLIIRNQDGEVVDLRAWTGTDHRHIKCQTFSSVWFGDIKPLDAYQKLLFDSLRHNQITMVKGPAGSGKTLISLGCLMQKLDKHELDKIIVFCNTVATANSAKLGFYPGTRLDKLLDSQIGNLLMSKFGSREGVQRLIDEEKLVLLPFSDLRGFDTTGMKAGIYISEAQNLDKTLIKLALQRVGKDCICIIDGDNLTQVDMPIYSGKNNGMRATSKVFRGHDIYGEVKLNNVYRSKIAEIAEAI